MIKKLITTVSIVFSVIVFGCAGIFCVYLYQPYGVLPQEIHIPKGTPTPSIIQTLVEKNVISNPTFFKIYLTLARKLKKIRAGDYVFPTTNTPLEVASMLQTGDFKRYRITLIEGWNLKQMATYLQDIQFANAEKFLNLCFDPEFIRELGFEGKSLEGYLFPDTYEIYFPRDERELIVKFVHRFGEIYSPAWRQRTQEMGWSLKDIVTLASIVEKETGVPEERPLVASVFHNRLQRKMPLEADPTVIYGLPSFSGNLTRRDLETPTAYNTYTLPGLPSGPIANPGKASLEAVLYPAKSDYLFFVSKNDGSHHFSTNMRDHGMAVRRYQSWIQATEAPPTVSK